MKFTPKELVLFILTVAVAIASMFLLRVVSIDNDATNHQYTFLWEKIIVSTIALASFIFGFIEQRDPWRWPLAIAYVHYFSGFFIMDIWGQIPPLELIYVSCLAVPGIATGFLGAFLANKFKGEKGRIPQ